MSVDVSNGKPRSEAGSEGANETPSAVASAAPALITHAGVLLVAAGVFGFIASRVASRKIHGTDVHLREKAQALRSDVLDVAVKPITILSVPLLVASATAALAFWLRHEKRTAAALAVAVTPVIAAAAGQSFTSLLAQRNPPDVDADANAEVVEPSFPSGHTTGVTAEALAIGYILSREELLASPALAALIAWPILVGVSRIYRDRHWTSDILGGFAAGTAVAAATSTLYELQRAKASGRA